MPEPECVHISISGGLYLFLEQRAVYIFLFMGSGTLRLCVTSALIQWNVSLECSPMRDWLLTQLIRSVYGCPAKDVGSNIQSQNFMVICILYCFMGPKAKDFHSLGTSPCSLMYCPLSRGGRHSSLQCFLL